VRVAAAATATVRGTAASGPAPRCPTPRGSPTARPGPGSDEQAPVTEDCSPRAARRSRRRALRKRAQQPPARRGGRAPRPPMQHQAGFPRNWHDMSSRPAPTFIDLRGSARPSPAVAAAEAASASRSALDARWAASPGPTAAPVASSVASGTPGNIGCAPDGRDPTTTRGSRGGRGGGGRRDPARAARDFPGVREAPSQRRRVGENARRGEPREDDRVARERPAANVISGSARARTRLSSGPRGGRLRWRCDGAGAAGCAGSSRERCAAISRRAATSR